MNFEKTIKRLHGRIWRLSYAANKGTLDKQIMAKKSLAIIMQEYKMNLRSLQSISKKFYNIVTRSLSKVIIKKFKDWVTVQLKTSSIGQIKKGEFIFWKNKLYCELSKKLPRHYLTWFERIKIAILQKKRFESKFKYRLNKLWVKDECNRS